MNTRLVVIVLFLSFFNACKKDEYVGKDPYAGARPPLNVKIKTVTGIQQATSGSVYHLSGSGFSEYKDSGMIVKFNDVPGELIAVSDTSVDARIPALASSGLVTLTINAQVFPGPQVRIKGPLYVDPAFVNVPGATGGNIDCIAAISGGKFVIGGTFTDYGNSGEKDGYHGIACIKSDGTLDNSFKVGKGFDGNVNAVVEQAGGKLVAGGSFNDFNERYALTPGAIANLVRLNEDGSLDTVTAITDAGNTIVLPAFNAYFDGSVDKILQSPVDGKLTVFGNFKYFMRKNFLASTADGLRDSVLIDSIRMEGAVRLNEDGSFDSTFNYDITAHRSGAGLNGSLNEALLMDNGRILLAGNFTRYHGQAAKDIIVIDSLGNIDPSFNTGAGPGDMVTAAALMPDGRVIVAGLFNSFDGKEARKVALLNANGSLAGTFNIGSGAAAGPDGKIDHIIVLKNNKIFLTGSFDYFSGIHRKGTVVLEQDGSVSQTYNNLGALYTGSSRNTGGVHQLISAPNINGFIMVGSFDNFDLMPAGHIVQLHY